MELNSIKEKLVHDVNEYINSVSDVSDWVMDNLNERVTDYLVARSKEIEAMHTEQINEQLNQYASYCY